MQYQFNWFDKDGFVIKGNHSPWRKHSPYLVCKNTITGLSTEL
ncbi:DUF1425 domain-containing protein [Pseudoalteromonas sp. B193]